MWAILLPGISRIWRKILLKIVAWPFTLLHLVNPLLTQEQRRMWCTRLLKASECCLGPIATGFRFGAKDEADLQPRFGLLKDIAAVLEWSIIDLEFMHGRNRGMSRSDGVDRGGMLLSTLTSRHVQLTSKIMKCDLAHSDPTNQNSINTDSDSEDTNSENETEEKLPESWKYMSGRCWFVKHCCPSNLREGTSTMIQ